MIIKSLKINNLEIPNTISSGYIIEQCLGFQNPATRIVSTDLPSQHGAFLQSNLYGERNLTIAIRVLGNSQADFTEKRQALMTQLNSDVDNEVKIPIEATRRGDDLEIKMLGIAGDVVDNMEKGQLTDGVIMFNFLCQDPAMYSVTGKSETIYLPTTIGGVSIPIGSMPFAIGTPNREGSETCNNAGNFKTSPNIMISGLCVNPIITNVTTGEAIQFNVTNSLPTDYISIDMKNFKATKTSGTTTTNIISNLDADNNEFWALQPDDNEITFSHEGDYNANTKCDINWRDAYIGI